MPYIENKKFHTPDDDTVIWHFMNFPEFCSILVHEKLFFTRSDCFDDPWEGAWPKYYHDKTFWIEHQGIPQGQVESIISFFDKSLDKRKQFAVSCWHMNPHESEPFWKLYSNQAFGVAIKSTIGDLKKSVDKSGWPINIGAIEYVNFDRPNQKSFLDSKGLDIPILYKRDVFRHEAEVRAFIKEQKDPGHPFKGERGRTVSIDPATLLNSVIVSPMATDWFVRVVKGMLEKFKLEKIECYKSNLYDRLPPIMEAQNQDG